MSRPFRQAGWEVIECDWCPKHDPTHVVDLMSWVCPYPPGYFDVVWASPDCTQYSRARTTAKTPRDLARADRLVERCLTLIDDLKPRLWFVENPDTGLLKTRAVVAELPFVRVDYCMYGAPYRKRTRIWTNAEWCPMLCDRSHLVQGRRVATAQRGPSLGTDRRTDRFSPDELHRLPEALCDEILRICSVR